MKILFTICGRAGSKGIKNKNISTFLGYSLPFYTVSIIDLYRKSNPEIYCDVVLNTDSRQLIDMFQQDLRVQTDIIERESTLGMDNTPKIDVISNCLEIMTQRKKTMYDMVIDLDITSPLRTLQDLCNLIEKKNEEVDVVFSVTNARRNPFFNMVKCVNGNYERVISTNFNTRQEAPEIYDMNASLYAYSPEFLKLGKGIFDGRCDIIIMQDTAVLDLDHENDFNLMQVIADFLYRTHDNYNIIRENIKNIIK